MGQSSNFGLRPVTIHTKLLKSTPIPLPALELGTFELLPYRSRPHGHPDKYLQIRGTAMGTNLLMSKHEHDFMQTQSITPRLWIRFSYDILILWTHGETNLNTFLD